MGFGKHFEDLINQFHPFQISRICFLAEVCDNVPIDSFFKFSTLVDHSKQRIPNVCKSAK